MAAEQDDEVKPLTVQIEETPTYKALEGKLRAYEVGIAALVMSDGRFMEAQGKQLEEQQARITELKKQCHELSDSEFAQGKQIESLQKDVASQRSTIQGKDADIAFLRSAIAPKDKQIANLTTEVHDLLAEIDNLNAEVPDLKKQIENLNSILASNDAEITRLKNSLRLATQKRKELPLTVAMSWPKCGDVLRCPHVPGVQFLVEDAGKDGKHITVNFGLGPSAYEFKSVSDWIYFSRADGGPITMMVPAVEYSEGK